MAQVLTILTFQFHYKHASTTKSMLTKGNKFNLFAFNVYRMVTYHINFNYHREHIILAG